MSDPGLFVVGVLVTLLVAAALSLLIYAAILDGRRDPAVRRAAGPSPSPQDRGVGAPRGASRARASDSRAARGAGGLSRRRSSRAGRP